jgi:hypothetical protein
VRKSSLFALPSSSLIYSDREFFKCSGADELLPVPELQQEEDPDQLSESEQKIPSAFAFFHDLPRDMFRTIFQYLNVADLMKLDHAFVGNKKGLSLYHSSLAGIVITENIFRQ